MAPKVVVDVRFLSSGGYGTYLKEILPRLMQLGLPLTLLGHPDEILATFGSNPVVIPCKAPPFSFQEQIELPLKVPPCDLFWSPNYNISWAATQAKKTLLTLHDAFPFYPFFPWVKGVYARLLLKYAAARASHILTVSHFSNQDLALKAGIKSPKITPIYLGVSKEHFHPYIDIPFWQEVKRLYNIPPSFILFVGNSKPHKNLEGALLAAKLANLPLVVVGMSPFNRSSTQALFLEKVPPSLLRALYQHATLLLYPSFYEGFGLPPLEAMACACPVMTSNLASLPEVCGHAALLVNPLDMDGIVRGIERICREAHLREKLKAEGLKRAALFDWDETARGHLGVIQALIF